MTARILEGECERWLAQLPSSSVDSLVTDPPAGISFMGKEWDGDKGGRDHWIAWLTGVMAECLRVLKPGGHGLVWGLPRTSHWTATALEDAGFEIRDVVTHHFGTGFPKSLDVSKAIDKAAGVERGHVVDTRNGPNTNPLTSGDKFSGGYVQESKPDIGPTTDAAKQWAGWGTALKPASEMWLLVRKPLGALDLIAIINEWLNEVDRGVRIQTGAAEGSSAPTATSWSGATANTFLNTVTSWKRFLGDVSSRLSTSTTGTKARATIVLKTLSCFLSEITPGTIIQDALNPSGGLSLVAAVDASFSASRLSFSAILALFAHAAATSTVGSSAASESESLKGESADRTVYSGSAPASEHWILVRKPFDTTVAANVQEHGTGAINVDACRIAGPPSQGGSKGSSVPIGILNDDGWQGGGTRLIDRALAAGRWPANVVFTHSVECVEVGTRKIKNPGGVPSSAVKDDSSPAFTSQKRTSQVHHFDEDGSETVAAWTCVEGCPVRELDGASRFFYCAKASTSEKEAGLSPGDAKRGNAHPTVKSIALMSYLVKLITPPGGVVIDPFAGSGTTGAACVGGGFSFIGIEKDPTFARIARERIAYWQSKVKPVGQLTIASALG